MPGGRVRLAPGRAKATVEWAAAGAQADAFVRTTLLELVNGVPCFEVRMGRDLVNDPVTTVRRLAEDVQG